MKKYLVGGAVRDELLGIPNLDRDWVIVGAHIDDVTQTGLRLHNETFGIFVDDQTGDEFALARRERKTADGHRGFEVQNGVDISLEEDLKRRDFTINAIAQSEDGTYVDPYGGRSDLDARWLRHVSPAFNEDPLRVWRGARFLSHLSAFQFRVHPTTLIELRKMTGFGEFTELSSARIWNETKKLRGVNQLLSYISALEAFGVWRAYDISTGAMDESISLRDDDTSLLTDRHAALVCLRLHAVGGNALAVFSTLGVPKKWLELLDVTLRFASHTWGGSNDALELMDLFEANDALRRPERSDLALTALTQCENSEWVRTAERLDKGLQAARSVDLSSLQSERIPGKEKAHKARIRRLEAINRTLK